MNTGGSSLRHWLVKFFIAVCLMIACFSLVIILARFEIMQAGQSLLLGAILFFSLLLVQRQFSMARDIKMLKDQSWDLAEYENDIDRRMEKMAQQTSSAATHNLPHNDVDSEALLSRISKLEAKLEQVHKDLILQIPQHGEPNALTAVAAMPTATMEPFNNALGLKISDEANRNPDLKRQQQAKFKLKAALKDNKLDLHLQPIVALPTRSPAYFESFMRLQTGEKQYLDAREFIKLAEDAGLMPMIDSKVVFSSVRMLRTLSALKKRAGLFCNISARTLSDIQTFGQIESFLAANTALKNALVLEINQSQYIGLKDKERSRLGNLVDLGFALSLDQVGDLRLDGATLASAGIRFIKVPSSILLHASIDDDHLGIHPSSLAPAMSEFGISVVATEIERERAAVDLIDLDIPFGQGYLFAPPRPVKAELLDPPQSMKTNARKRDTAKADAVAVNR